MQEGRKGSEMPSVSNLLWAGNIFGYGLSQDPGLCNAGTCREKGSLIPFSSLLHPVQLLASLHLHLYWLKITCGDICENIGTHFQSPGTGRVGLRKVQCHWGPTLCVLQLFLRAGEGMDFALQGSRQTQRTSQFFFLFPKLWILHIDRPNSQITDTLTGTLQNTESNIPPGFLSLLQGRDLIFRF